MHVFVTGGTGTIGSAVVAELLGNGHTVLALARSDSSERSLKAAGAEVLRGGLADRDVLQAGAAQADGVISLPSAPTTRAQMGSRRQSPRRAPPWPRWARNSSAETARSSPYRARPRVAGRASTEEDPLPLEGPVAGRARSVNALLEMASQGVRATAVRMPRTVHNQGRGGFAGMLTDQARRSGISGYPGDGTQRWPAVHALDAAVLFRLALESAPAGTSWHAVADEGDAVRDIAAVIGRRLGLPVETVPQETFGPFGPIFAVDQPASSAHTRELLGWEPTHPSLLRSWRTSGPDWWNPNKPIPWRSTYESSSDL